MRGLGTRLFGGSRVPVHRRSRGSSSTVIVLPTPVWTAVPSYTAEDGVSSTAYTLPVGASGDVVTVTWISGTISGNTVLSQPSWIELTPGVSPTIRFTGTQVDANDVTNMVLRATSAGGYSDSQPGTITISASTSGSIGLSITFNSSEGWANPTGTLGGQFPRVEYAGGGGMWYESAYTTKDGTMIEAFTGEHGTFNNRIGEFRPSTDGGVTPGTMAEVFPNDFAATGVSGYDNLNYLYFDAIDTLIVFNRGAFDRRVTNVNGSAWTHFAYSTSSYPGSWPTSVTIPPYGRPPLHSTNSSHAQALLYVRAADQDGYQNGLGYYNIHAAYSKQFDVGVVLGGGSSASPPDGYYYLRIFMPSRYISSSIVPRYSVINRLLSNAEAFVGGEQAILAEGRAGAKFVGKWLYWVGGFEDSNRGKAFSRRLWRTDITRFLNSSDPYNEPFVAEPMANAPSAQAKGTLSYDPYSNTLLLFNSEGVFLYDISADSWQTITNQLPEYVSARDAVGLNLSGELLFLNYCHADFIDFRGTTNLRKTYFFGGLNGYASYTSPNRTTSFTLHQKVRSLKVTRTGDVSFINAYAISPEDGSQKDSPLWSIKHQSLLVYGTGENRRLQLWSGDYGPNGAGRGWAYPPHLSSPPAGYKAESVGDTNWGSGRQEIWRANIGTSALAANSVNFQLVHNGYAGYPWTGSAASFPAAQKGPWASDGYGQIIDKRGQFWMGPCSGSDGNLYVNSAWEVAGLQTINYAAMFKYNDPAATNTTGYGFPNVPLGTGWTLPSQDRLQNNLFSGSVGTDYDIGSGGNANGWGRPHSTGSVYDSVNDRIYTLALQLDAGNKRFGIKLMAFNPDPAAAAANGGKYAWAASAWNYIKCKNAGGPSDHQFGGLNMPGNAGDGVLNTAPQMIGRLIYFVALLHYTSPTNGLVANNHLGTVSRAHLCSINVDTGAISWIPFPQSQPWFLRAWDGEYAMPASDTTIYGTFGAWPQTPAQYRGLACVGTKLVLGPDSHTKIGVDPWIQVYDTVTKVWTAFQAPTDHDWPQTLFPLVGVPDLGEVWLAGTLTTDFQNDQFRIDYGIHRPTNDAGRRIVRFKVA